MDLNKIPDNYPPGYFYNQTISSPSNIVFIAANRLNEKRLLIDLNSIKMVEEREGGCEITFKDNTSVIVKQDFDTINKEMFE